MATETSSTFTDPTTLGTDRYYVDPKRGHPLTTGVRWLSVESTLRWLDPLLLVSRPPRAQDLGAALGDAAAIALLARQIIRFSGQHLQLLEIGEVHRQARQHHVALAIGLSDDELMAADEMNLAALCLVPDPEQFPVRWLSRWQPVWISQPEPCVPACRADYQVDRTDPGHAVENTPAWPWLMSASPRR